MLTLSLQEDSSGLELALFGDVLPCGSRVILMQENVPCGVAIFRLTANAIHIDRVAIASEIRGKSIGDFFIRSLLYKFSFYEMDIIVGWRDSYFAKLGFIPFAGSEMIARDGVILFPSKCGGCKQ